MIFNSIIPLPYYTPVFYNTLLVIIVLSFSKLLTKGYVIQNSNKKEYVSLLLLLGVVVYMGLRPVSGRYFGDMGRYAREFMDYANGEQINILERDYFWRLITKLFSSIMTVKIYFVVCAALYVFPLYKVAKNWLGEDRYFLFLMFIASFSFWGAGTNGIRNAIASSIFLYGLSICKKHKIGFALIVLSYFIHGSMIIPIAAFILTMFYKKTSNYLLGWLIAIPLSFFFGGAIENLFLSIGIGGSRLQYLNLEGFEEQFSSTGFRWDFLLYSSAAVYVGYYFIIKRKFNDEIYHQIFNIYVVANAFWVLMIRATFSNRFAYLSWFLMAVVIFYPFFKQQFFKKQQKVLAYTVITYFGFTYLMFLIK